MSLIEWTGNEPEDIIITKVLKSATSDHWYAVYQAWESYLNENLTFPFDAKIFDGEYWVDAQIPAQNYHIFL